MLIFPRGVDQVATGPWNVAQPDKKANSWNLVRPGKFQISLLSHQGRVLCGLHFQGLAGTDVHNLTYRRSQGLTGTDAHSLPHRRSQQNAQGVSCYPSSIPDAFSVDSVPQHHKATESSPCLPLKAHP